jgi:outer membrane protein assembly factor BamB
VSIIFEKSYRDRRKQMKTRHIYLITLLILISILFSSCSGSRSISATSWPGITVDQDNVYLSYTTGIFALRLSDGQMVWRYPAEADNKILFYASPAKVDGQIVVGDYGTTLYAIKSESGTQSWLFTGAKGRWISDVLPAGDLILAPNADNWLYALSQDGALQWKFETEKALWAAPAFDGTNVYLPSMDHFLYALNSQGGQEIWKVDLGGAIVHSPLLSEEGVLYVGTLGKEVVAVDASDGSVLWRFPTEKEVWGTPVLNEGVIFFGDLNGNVYAVDAVTGTQKWVMEAGVAVAGGGVVTPDGVVFTTEDGNILMIGFDGTKQWTQTIEGKLYGSPVATEDTIIVGITQGENVLVALTMNGTIKWTFAIPE